MRNLHRVIAAFLLLLCVPLAAASAQETQSRFAFIVGNDGYEGAPLATAANDAALVADALKSAKFDVTGARNLDQDTLRASYREFLAKVTAAGPGAVSVVYLSGYGLQFDGENYFVPPGSAIARDADISLNAIRLSDLIRPLSGAPGRGRVVLLDLAYQAPFAKQAQGLAPGLAIVEPEAGTIVGLNAAPGTWAAPGKEPYGAYAQALSEMLREPGLPIEEVLVRVRTRTAELTKAAQLPWSAGKIDPPLVLLERAADAPAPAVPQDQVAAERAKPLDKMPVGTAYAAAIDRDTIKGYEDFVAAYPQSPYTKNVQGIVAARREARTWRRTLDINTQNAYWSYLKRYPRGPHAADARRRLGRLQAALEPPPAFDPIVYEDAPPPPVEEAYFAGPEIVYYDDTAPPLPPSIFIAAPPPWYQPPPPPMFDEDEDFFLPEIVAAVATPAWIAPPPYVAPPPVPLMMENRPAGWRPMVAIPAALAVGLAAGRLSNRFLDNRRQAIGQPARPPRPPILPAISAPPKGVTLPAGVRPGQPFVRPATVPAGQPLVRPVQPGQPAGVVLPNQPGAGRPGTALPNLPNTPAVRPGVVQPGGPNAGSAVQPLPGMRPGQPIGAGRPNPPVMGAPGAQPAQPLNPNAPGVAPGARPATPPGVQPGMRPGAAGQAPVVQPPGAADRRQQLIQQQQQRQQQLIEQQQQRQQKLQQQQQQRVQQQQLRQQQMQEQRTRQMQQQQERVRQQQMNQQRDRQQQMLQQQRQNQMQQQQRAQQQQMMQQRQIQQQRQNQLMQQQRQNQMLQQQRQQQMIIQQQRQQQMIIQQQRQQQMIQQQRQQQTQPRRCPPNMVRC